ncbi:unnamed protein product [Moneuplotes crassus]|uniref:Uncharacterized protein n=1 Tax=Euplotes crassus TaxID=5936 RepID=A0AAD1U6S8_EUPCR|nr:unnamed protein product [Moneuplotes crassus]
MEVLKNAKTLATISSYYGNYIESYCLCSLICKKTRHILHQENLIFHQSSDKNRSMNFVTANFNNVACKFLLKGGKYRYLNLMIEICNSLQLNELDYFLQSVQYPQDIHFHYLKFTDCWYQNIYQYNEICAFFTRNDLELPNIINKKIPNASVIDAKIEFVDHPQTIHETNTSSYFKNIQYNSRGMEVYSNANIKAKIHEFDVRGILDLNRFVECWSLESKKAIRKLLIVLNCEITCNSKVIVSILLKLQRSLHKSAKIEFYLFDKSVERIAPFIAIADKCNLSVIYNGNNKNDESIALRKPKLIFKTNSINFACCRSKKVIIRKSKRNNKIIHQMVPWEPSMNNINAKELQIHNMSKPIALPRHEQMFYKTLYKQNEFSDTCIIINCDTFERSRAYKKKYEEEMKNNIYPELEHRLEKFQIKFKDTKNSFKDTIEETVIKRSTTFPVDQVCSNLKFQILTALEGCPDYLTFKFSRRVDCIEQLRNSEQLLENIVKSLFTRSKLKRVTFSFDYFRNDSVIDIATHPLQREIFKSYFRKILSYEEINEVVDLANSGYYLLYNEED